MTLYEAWFGLKPSVKHLKVFGLVCYFHIPIVKRSKLDETAELGILLGYTANSKGTEFTIWRLRRLQLAKILK